MQHGLKYESYQRYTSYCSRRLHRLRKSLNVYQGIASSAKARHQRARKLFDVSNSMIIEAGEKDLEYGERMLMIQLFLAERAWSHSMLLKQESSEQPRKRFHLSRRFRKAAVYADKFEALVNAEDSPCTERTKEEATAYASYIKGMYKVEKGAWTEANDELYKSLTLYLKLSVSLTKPTVLEHYRQRIEEIRASLKYCAFNLGDQATKVQIKVTLPAKLQFHDVAYKHALKELDAIRMKKADQQVVAESSPVKVEHKEDKQATTTKPPQAAAAAAVKAVPVVDEDEEEDQFEETQEGHADAVAADEEDSESDSADDEPAQTGGVTGLVKNWLGGWSK